MTIRNMWRALVLVSVAAFGGAGNARAASVEASAPTQSKSGRAGGKISASSRGVSAQSRSEAPPVTLWGHKLPAFVMGGNAVTLQAPFQFSAGSYAPRWRLGVQYERQLYRAHWIHGGVALLWHRGDYKRFGSNGCGIEGVEGVCEAGAVVGFDLWGGYTHKIFLRRFPYLVPMARGGIGFARWAYPDIGASRQQARESAISVSARLGGGVRFFLLSNVGIGADVNFQIGLVRHKDRPIMANNRPADVEHSTEPLFGFELFPLVGEFRF